MDRLFALRATSSFLIAIVLSLVASVGVLTATEHPAHAQTPIDRPQVGVAFHAMWSDYTDAQRSAAIQRFADAGIEWVRIDLGWSSFQENGRDSYSQWYFDRADSVINELRANGIKVMGLLWATPGWANGGQPREVPPDDPGDYGVIARKVAEHFRGRVDAWEVWNEPNDSFFEGTAAQYAALLKAAYPQFKAGDPDAEVVLGGPTHNDTDWLRKLYEHGASGYFDIMATHPYQGMGDDPPEVIVEGAIWTMTHVEAVHDLMVEFGDGDKEIWFTEFGWSAHENWDGVPNWQRGVSESQQADYLIRAIQLMARDYPYVTNMFWYNDRNRASGNASLDNYGLMRRDLTPKPVYDRLQEFLTSEVPAEPSPEPDPLPADDEPSPASTPPPTDTSDPSSRRNLLSNGDFETGIHPWRAPRGRVSLDSRSHSGSRSTLVSSKGRVRTLVSELVSVPGPTVVEVSGHVKVPRTGQRIRLVVIEQRDGRRVQRWGLSLQVMGTRWAKLPTIRYGTKGDTEVKVKLRMRSKRGRHFLADDLYLRPTE